MPPCFDCYKLNPQDELRRILEEAKKAAVKEGETKAIYLDGGEYKFISLREAQRVGIPVMQVLSEHL